MKTVIGVLTHNAVSSLRFGLLEQTLSSLRASFGDDAPICVFDNGSTDGSAEAVRALEAPNLSVTRYRPPDGNHTPGRGRNELALLLGVAYEQPGTIWVLSDDDVLWKPEAGDMLRRFWSEAPADVTIVGALMEPDYDWNQPRGIVESGGVRALVRKTVPAAAWTLRGWQAWKQIEPLKTTLDGDGEDVEACRWLGWHRQRVAALDLAEHAGQGLSLCGNDEARRLLAARDIDKAAWGL